MDRETQAPAPAAGQVDIFGETQAPEPELTGYLTRDASVPQAKTLRLFEPQMEGQLSLDDA